MEPRIIWITGLSGSGKTSLAHGVAKRLKDRGIKTVLLDGDNLRQVLGLTDSKKENYNRNTRLKAARIYGKLCKLLADQGFWVVIATISMFQEVYKWNRGNLPNYFEIYLKSSVQLLCEEDPKGIYKTPNGELAKNISGIDIAVDEPDMPHLTFDREISNDTRKLTEIVIENLKI